MSLSSYPPARVLIERVSADLGGLWSLLYAAELTVLRVGSEPGRLDAGAVTAAMDLRQAVEELEWFHPDLGTGAAALDLAPVTGPEGSRVVVEDLLNAALGITSVLVTDPDLAVEDVLLLARVVALIVAAHQHLTGRLP